MFSVCVFLSIPWPCSQYSITDFWLLSFLFLWLPDHKYSGCTLSLKWMANISKPRGIAMTWKRINGFIIFEKFCKQVVSVSSDLVTNSCKINTHDDFVLTMCLVLLYNFNNDIIQVMIERHDIYARNVFSMTWIL